MCGIFGFNWEDRALLRKGLEKIEHRGPDSSGSFVKKGISLGHNRLSIIDLSKAGNQPMTNEDKSLQIIFVGEIYNYDELRDKLKERHSFKSLTDTEVILHLYEEEGFNVVKKLQGMFAFCIYDSRKKVLFLARDRVGIKPLYYYEKSGKFIFSSEIKAILEHKKVVREVNLEALESYLTFRANICEETFFKGIKKLMPGHTATYDLSTKKIVIDKYWEAGFNEQKGDFDLYSKEIRRLLTDSVKLQMRSDVPFGVYLSGGIDSTCVTALMSKHTNIPIKTFSVGFKGEENGELQRAKDTSRMLKTDHHELIIGEDSIRLLPEIVYHADEPIADPTIIPTYLLSKYARRYCKVILTGEGADELFAGYPQYGFMYFHARFIGRLPKFIRKMIVFLVKRTPASLLNIFFPFSSSLGKKGIERFEKYVLSNNIYEQYFNQVSIFNKDEQERLLGKKVEIPESYKKHFTRTNVGNIINKTAEFEFKGPMVDDLLMKVDKNTMAFGIEGRVPFLDHRIVELAGKIPESYKMSLTQTKKILRHSMRGLLPERKIKQKKRHFFVPIDLWLKDQLSNLRTKLLSEEYVKKQGLFNWEYIKEINRRFEESPLFYARQLWALIIFQIWHKIYIEREKVII